LGTWGKRLKRWGGWWCRKRGKTSVIAIQSEAVSAKAVVMLDGSYTTAQRPRAAPVRLPCPCRAGRKGVRLRRTACCRLRSRQSSIDDPENPRGWPADCQTGWCRLWIAMLITHTPNTLRRLQELSASVVEWMQHCTVHAWHARLDMISVRMGTKHKAWMSSN